MVILDELFYGEKMDTILLGDISETAFSHIFIYGGDNCLNILPYRCYTYA